MLQSIPRSATSLCPRRRGAPSRSVPSSTDAGDRMSEPVPRAVLLGARRPIRLTDPLEREARDPASGSGPSERDPQELAGLARVASLRVVANTQRGARKQQRPTRGTLSFFAGTE